MSLVPPFPFHPLPRPNSNNRPIGKYSGSFYSQSALQKRDIILNSWPHNSMLNLQSNTQSRTQKYYHPSTSQLSKLQSLGDTVCYRNLITESTAQPLSCPATFLHHFHFRLDNKTERYYTFPATRITNSKNSFELTASPYDAAQYKDSQTRTSCKQNHWRA